MGYNSFTVMKHLHSRNLRTIKYPVLQPSCMQPSVLQPSGYHASLLHKLISRHFFFCRLFDNFFFYLHNFLSKIWNFFLFRYLLYRQIVRPTFLPTFFFADLFTCVGHCQFVFLIFIFNNQKKISEFRSAVNFTYFFSPKKLSEKSGRR